MTNGSQNILWSPQPGPQKALIDCPFPEIFFGGARGGGKTDGVLGKWALKEQRYGASFNALMFRRTTVSSEDAIERSKEIYGPLGGTFTGSPQPTWRMPNGGRVSFRYLDREQDADEWQGRNVTDVWVEEAGQYPNSRPIDKLFGVLRSSAGVPTQMILTANPGGPGQLWLRDRYHLSPFPRHAMVHERALENGSTHRFAVIPSRITDNQVLLRADPQYIDRLHMVGSRELVRAWLEGDWSAVEGAFFDRWSSRNVVEPFDIPRHWLRFRSMDWGHAAPFSVGWWAVVSEPTAGLPRGALLRYREWYGSDGRPNQGLRLTAQEVARGILEREAGDRIAYGVLDPSAFATDGGPSIAERMMSAGATFRPADNTRVGKRGAFLGWDAVRARIAGAEEGPMLAIFDTCHAFARTVPVLQHDPARPEDLDTSAEDHVADEVRYACMSRPWAPTLPSVKPKQPTGSVYYPGPPQDRHDNHRIKI